MNLQPSVAEVMPSTAPAARTARETRSPRRLRPSLIAASLAALWLAGCAVRPTPFTDAERVQSAQADRTAMFADQPPLAAPVTLEEAMARAIRYNLDHRLKMMEEALAQKQLDVANFDMLPRLTAQAGYTNRNHPLASSSEGLYTNTEVVPPSFSTDQNDRTADLMFSWNLLDFGVSYFEAKEQADRVLVVEQRRRKVMQLMMQQVREAYWEAVGAQRLSSRVGPLLAQAKQALDDSRQSQQEGLRSPLDTLAYQHSLLDIMRQLEIVRDQLDEARPRLASLMNVAPGTDFTLAPPEGFARPTFDMPMERMEETALERRPELVEASYNERISINETHKAIAKLLPGIEVQLGGHYDSNSFLVYHAWRAAGINVSWNLLNVLNAKNIRGLADAQHEVAHAQRLALSMAVLTQVHVARAELSAKERQFDLNRQINDVDSQILQHTHNATIANAQGKLEEIRAATSAMMSELRLYQSYGELESAYGQMLATIGLDAVPANVGSADLKSIEQSIDKEQLRWAAFGHADGVKTQ
ncbi:TolC family protein [Paraburkholderia sp. RG36]|uniref:TolC family protein n=2 Tax=Paraburkholderia tagetis TaxID=2913261 RepID=A0A9X1RMI7_9BURK|nr:TolC family protein [Paraburkholderia tagetis]MCG5073235.1 TolC family protein [Paraburkholderia tagetis]